MILEAIVIPTTISQKNPAYDPAIHVPAEVLRSSSFQTKMVGLPVTAYHHNTMKAIHQLEATNAPINGRTMRQMLTHLNQTKPSGKEVVAKRLKELNRPPTLGNQIAVYLSDKTLLSETGGVGVIGTVTAFWQQGQQWLVRMDIDNNKTPIQIRNQIGIGRALGEISLTHGVIDGVIEPLEVSFTIQGLRTGSRISRIVQASRNIQQSNSTMTEEAPSPMELLYNELGALDKDGGKKLQDRFLQAIKTVQNKYVEASAGRDGTTGRFLSPAAEAEEAKKVAELEEAKRKAKLNEEAFDIIATTVSHALTERGLEGVGSLRSKTIEEYRKNPIDLANANNLVMASMGLETRKRKNDEEFKDVMSSIFPSKQTTTVMASKAQEPATQAAEPVDFGLQYLRNMRATFQQQ